MSRFFVGQRVRVVLWWARPCLGYELIGREAIVNQTDATTVGRPAVGITVAGCSDWAAPEWGLEPILPDGHRAGEEGKCELLDELLERQREAA